MPVLRSSSRNSRSSVSPSPSSRSGRKANALMQTVAHRMLSGSLGSSENRSEHKASASSGSGPGDSTDEAEDALATPSSASPTVSGEDAGGSIAVPHDGGSKRAAQREVSLDDYMDETPDIAYITAELLNTSTDFRGRPNHNTQSTITNPMSGRAEHAPQAAAAASGSGTPAQPSGPPPATAVSSDDEQPHEEGYKPQPPYERGFENMDRITREQLDLWSKLCVNCTMGVAGRELLAFAARYTQHHLTLLTYWQEMLQRRLDDVKERDSFNFVIARLQTDIHTLEIRKFALTARLEPGWISSSGALTPQGMADVQEVEAEAVDLLKKLDLHIDLP